MPVTKFAIPEQYQYQNGFGSYHETEAIKGALLIGHNSPQKSPFGLYAEKLSGTAFTAPCHENLQSWLCRIRSAAAQTDFEPYAGTDPSDTPRDNFKEELHQIPNQLRWDLFDLDLTKDWVHSLRSSVAPAPIIKTRLDILIFATGKDMGKEGL